MISNYSKAYVEVLEILKYIPKEEKEKIPKDILKTLESKADFNYNFSLDFNVTFDKQKLLDETKAILANFFRDYWATDFQKEQILLKEKLDMKNKKEEEFDYDKMFKRNKLEKNFEDKSEEKLLIVQNENKKWYTFFVDFIKKILNKK